jgi:hypothetical protein
MIDLQKRLRRTFSSMAANESLEDVADEDTAAQILRWGETVAEQFVLKTKDMEDEVAYEYLSPYSSALRKMMRAMGQWVSEKDPDTRLEWWYRIEQNGKTLFSDRFMLPAMNEVVKQTAEMSMGDALTFLSKLIETIKAKG